MNILDGLNKEQETAVKHFKGPLLILAGAGSGKTRVLTHRIAYLIEEYGVNPWNILALTFTNKAAKEMRERVDGIVNYGAENIWVSTFHSTCVRILRRYIESIGYSRSFTIYDTDDQKALIRDICKYLKIDTKKFKEKQFMNVISSCKDELITPEQYEIDAAKEYGKKMYVQVYNEYQKRLKSNNALDFDDLIMKTVELLQTSKEALDYYQNRFKYILVDEYQDTNTAQFVLLSLMATTTNEYGEREHNLCVVGDDDQSIYKFRGANIYNILNFEKQYPDTKVIRLEQNYRSTKTILEAANEVIKNNSMRKEKALWTEHEQGEPIEFKVFDNEYKEAEGIVKAISNGSIDYGNNYREYAILYRTNAQSRVFEEKLVMSNIPYRIVGAVNFYSRKEIKDLLCYLKVVCNGDDDVAVKRIINIPKRGIGLTTIDRIMEYSIENGVSFYDACKRAEFIDGLSRAANKISSFVSFIEILKEKISSPDYSIEDLMNEIIEVTGYVESLKLEATEEAEGRIENINELTNKIVYYEEQQTEEPATLNGFLEEVALVADFDTVSEDSNQVLLMTMHSAKGLEFPYVFICGMEDGIFPSSLSLYGDDPSEIEEERRLCYVGITRAMKNLTLTAARQRMRNGETNFNRPSRFITEIPRFLMKQSIDSTDQKRQTGNGTDFTSGASNFTNNKDNPFSNNPFITKGASGLSKTYGLSSQAKAKSDFHGTDYQVGDKVKHIKFGTGTVSEMKKISGDVEVVIEFEGFGMRKLRASFAKLQRV